MLAVFMLITFDSTHKAISFERLLLENFDIELIPTPREIAASCGLSLKFDETDFEAIKEALKSVEKKDTKVFHYDKYRDPKAIERTWGE